MEDPETAQIFEADDFSLIDVSASDDDFLLASSSEASTVDNPGDIFAGVRINQPSDSVDLQRPRKNGNCNLRKSLAWDSAFFTSAGVLDAEELSSIIEGNETGVKQKHFLPGIQEDLTKSTDSISTFESDNLTLESLEADLFCDIRASIQRSTTKTVEPSSTNMVKVRSSSKKLNPSIQGPGKTLKSGPKQVMKPPIRSRESTSLLRQPHEPAGRPSLPGASATKKVSVGASQVKLESCTAGNSKGKGASLTKVSHQADSSTTKPKTLASSKFSSTSSVLNRATVRSSRSSCDSNSSSSENSYKSQSDAIRKKMDKNVHLPSAPKVRTPSRVLVKSKSQPGGSHLSTYLKSSSSSEVTASISPASSVSEWSTESSSSTATVNQKHIGLKPCPNSSGEIVVNRNVSQYSYNHSNKPSTGGSDVPLSRPASAKPSGLRMPSPKIGFFDGAKTGNKTPSGGSRSRSALPSSLPRSGVGSSGPPGIANKTKLGNIAAKMTTPAGNVKPNPRRTDANLKPTVHLQDHPDSLQKPLSSNNVDDDIDTNSEILKSVSTPNSALEANNKVAPMEGAKPEGKSNSAIDLITLTLEDGFNTGDINGSIILSSPKELCDYNQNEESRQFANFIPNSPLPSLEVSPGTRTPFAVKNSVVDVVEACNTSTGVEMEEALVKVEASTNPEKVRKENS